MARLVDYTYSYNRTLAVIFSRKSAIFAYRGYRLVRVGRSRERFYSSSPKQKLERNVRGILMRLERRTAYGRSFAYAGRRLKP